MNEPFILNYSRNDNNDNNRLKIKYGDRIIYRPHFSDSRFNISDDLPPLQNTFQSINNVSLFRTSNEKKHEYPNIHPTNSFSPEIVKRIRSEIHNDINKAENQILISELPQNDINSLSGTHLVSNTSQIYDPRTRPHVGNNLEANHNPSNPNRPPFSPATQSQAASSPILSYSPYNTTHLSMPTPHLYSHHTPINRDVQKQARCHYYHHNTQNSSHLNTNLPNNNCYSYARDSTSPPIHHNYHEINPITVPNFFHPYWRAGQQITQDQSSQASISYSETVKVDAHSQTDLLIDNLSTSEINAVEENEEKKALENPQFSRGSNSNVPAVGKSLTFNFDGKIVTNGKDNIESGNVENDDIDNTTVVKKKGWASFSQRSSAKNPTKELEVAGQSKNNDRNDKLNDDDDDSRDVQNVFGGGGWGGNRSSAVSRAPSWAAMVNKQRDVDGSRASVAMADVGPVTWAKKSNKKKELESNEENDVKPVLKNPWARYQKK